MKQKLLAVIMAVAMLCTVFTMQITVVNAEKTDSTSEDLRVWFDFSTDSYFRDNIFLDVRGKDIDNLPMIVLQSEVTFNYGVAESETDPALNFVGGTGVYDEEEKRYANDSAAYISSKTNLFSGDNVTINIVFKNETNDQMQPIFCAGTSESNYLVLMTSWPAENAGPRMALKANNGTEQKFAATAENIPEVGTWNMLTYVQEGTNGKLYLNGQLVAEEELQYKLEDIESKYAYTDGLYFYSLGAPTVFENDPGFKGLVDDFRIYGSALTQEDIQALATSLNIEVDTEEEGTGNEGTGNEGTGNEGTGNEGTGNEGTGNEGTGNEGTGSTTPADSVVIDWDFSDTDSVKDVVLGNGVTIENGKAVFAEGNQGIALPDDIFKDAQTITIEMTIQPSKFDDYMTLLGVGDQVGQWVVMGVMKDGSVRYAVATNGDDASESKGNSVSGVGGNSDGVVGSDIVLTTDKEYAVKYVITKDETKVYVDGQLALTVPTEGKDLIGSIGGPVVVAKSTKWGDQSFAGTMSSFKVTLGTVSEGNGDNSGNQNGAGDADDKKPVTGDVAVLATILTAGVAAFGSLKLRKKVK